MSRTTRTLLAVATTTATMGIGVVGARMWPDDEQAAPLADSAPVRAVVVDDADLARTATPILAPVLSGDGEPDYDALAAAAVGEDGELIASPEIGGILAPPVDIAAEAVPRVFDDAVGVIPLPDPAYDICAGPAAGDTPPPGCPDGYGGSLLASTLPPEPQLWAAEGARLACGEQPANTITVYSATPLESLTVAWRPFGSAEAWATVEGPRTASGQRAAWEERFAAEDYSLAEFGYLAHCGITVERDPDTAYEVRLTARDSFGRDISGTATLADASPAGRPPTTATIDDDSVAQLRAFTTERGSVVVAAFNIGDRSEANCPASSIEHGRIPDEQTHVRDRAYPTAVGVYDPAYSRLVTTAIPLAPGELVLVCVRVYDSPNPLRPLATDAFVLEGPQVLVPRVVLHDVRFTEPLDLAAGEVAVQVGTAADDCGAEWRSEDRVTAGRLSIRPLAEFSCPGLAAPLDGRGTRTLQIATRRLHEGRWLSSSYSFNIPRRDCSTMECGRVLYWEEYAVPMPPTQQVLCGRPFWDSSPCNPPGDGVVLVNVLYDLVGSGQYGAADYLGSSDRPETGPIGGYPVVRLLGGQTAPTFSLTAVPAQLSIVADRSLTLESLRLSGLEVPSGTDPACLAFPDTVVASAPATEFAATVTICAGVLYEVWATVVDTDGTRTEVSIGATSVFATSNDLVARVEVLGGDAPAFGWFYEQMVLVESGLPYAGGWTGPAAPDQPRCRSLDTTVGEFRWRGLVMLGSTVDVRMSLNITSAGDSECPLTGRGAPGLVELSGSFTLEQLFSGAPLVLTTPADSPLQLRITLTGSWQLGELNIQT